MTLKQAITASHNKAEEHRFVVCLLAKKMTSEAYAEYLHNQYQCYKALETRALSLGLLEGISDVCRAEFILQDALELGGSSHTHQSTLDYVDYVQGVSAERLWAHIYGRHFADLYGGQLIKKVAPGSCTMYNFADRATLIAVIRPKLSDNLSNEANLVFEYAIRLFEEVATKHGI